MGPNKTIVPAGFGILAAVFLTLAAWSWTTIADDPREMGLSYDPVREIGSIRPHEEREVRVMLANRTGRAVHVLGATNLCGTGICVKAEGLPIAILPRSERLIRVRMMGSIVPGEFSQGFTVYTDCPGQSEVVLTFVGHLAAPPAHATDGALAAPDRSE